MIIVKGRWLQAGHSTFSPPPHVWLQVSPAVLLCISYAGGMAMA